MIEYGGKPHSHALGRLNTHRQIIYLIICPPKSSSRIHVKGFTRGSTTTMPISTVFTVRRVWVPAQITVTRDLTPFVSGWHRTHGVAFQATLTARVLPTSLLTQSM